MSERYYDIDGNRLPSVTTIIGKLMDKPVLVPWAAKETANAFEDILTSTYYFPSECQFVIPDTDLPDILKTAKGAIRKKKQDALDKGTIVHNIIEQYLASDGRMTVDEVSDPVAKQGLEQFLAWGNQHDIEVLEFEKQVHYGNLYAGRFDLLAIVDGKRTLVDFKTSSGIWETEYLLQLHAYANCEDNVSDVAILRMDKETGEIEYKSWSYDPAISKAFIYLSKAFSTLFPERKKKDGN